jgi:molybdate transport system substrate-binding protein
MTRSAWRTRLGALVLLLCAGWSQAQPVVVAASDLKFALEEVAALFEKDQQQKVRLVFGSSGNFYSQILQGAPFQMFLSADEAFVFKLADAGKTKDRGQLYALGRIGIMVPHGSALKADGELKDLAAALKDGRLKKFAIANPDHAPYGARARETLQHAGLWQALEPRLVLGENISQATQFAVSGATQGGIIAQSLALAPAIARLGNFALIPDSWHQPLRQRMVLMNNAAPAAQAFYAYLATPPAQAVMRRYGFVMPRE